MTRKMQKKTRNIVSGILVGIASIFAVINFADIPAADVRGFILSTLLFFVAIILLALLAVSIFKLLAWMKNKLLGGDKEQASSHPHDHPPEDNDRI